jgi:SAM-dependent methyltransferase
MAKIANVEQAAAWDGPQGDVWVEREDTLNASLAPHTEALLAAADVRGADRVLDVGCGTGATTRACARRATDGHVMGVDLSGAMLQRARERAASERVRNVAFEQGDAQVHRFPPERFDLVLSRFGVMFFDDPVAAFANLRRATVAGGRFVAVVWQSVERNPWIALPRAALALGGEAPPIPTDRPGPMGLAHADRTRALLTAAGWSDVELDDVAAPYEFGPDVESAVAHVRNIGMVRSLLDGLDAACAERGIDALRALMAEHATDDGVRLGSRAWVIHAARRSSDG